MVLENRSAQLDELFNTSARRARTVRIRVYAEILKSILSKWVPLAYEALEEYRLNEKRLSATAVKIMTALIHGEAAEELISSMSDREWRDMQQTFHLKVERRNK